jgi:hypothetical protein
MRSTNHVVLMEEMINSFKILVKNLKVRDHSENLGKDRRIILEWILGK